jgi:hypothetical protein
MNSKTKKQKENREEIVKAIRKVLSSLDSHLDWTVKKATKKAVKCGNGSRCFHIKACKEYNEVVACLLKQL